jgi:hypothetical protein
MEKQKQKKSIVKINTSLAQANEWTKKAKELKISRSKYLLGVINQNNKPSLLKLIINKIKGN